MGLFTLTPPQAQSATVELDQPIRDESLKDDLAADLGQLAELAIQSGATAVTLDLRSWTFHESALDSLQMFRERLAKGGALLTVTNWGGAEWLKRRNFSLG